MGSQYERLFATLPRISAPSYLCERVEGAIRRERARRARARLALSSLSGVLSGAGLLVAGRALASAAYQTGFSSYASLVLSDGGALTHDASAFGLSLLESLPGPEVALSLALLSALIQSLRVFAISAVDWRQARPAAA